MIEYWVYDAANVLCVPDTRQTIPRSIPYTHDDYT
jgi:hypothetical protein